MWEVESLYDDARRSMTEILAAKGIDRSTSEEIQQTIDQSLHQTMGYSAQRFPESFERTLIYFFPNASNQERNQIRAIAEQVFLRPAIVHEALHHLVTILREGYKLGIVTAGERWVQESRLRQFVYQNQFDVIEIVPRKDVATFVAFAARNSIDATRSWLVGDSVRSDIIPGHAAGFNCILLRSHNWHRVETESMVLPSGVYEISDLSEILSIIPLRAT
ncbi:HAD hydrolase-like protein [Bradyrhizobium neotropicale]|nr:HAD hydrolase-like protein [Bradyrhizobium neotropicale]